jgi:hypothetical protein
LENGTTTNASVFVVFVFEEEAFASLEGTSVLDGVDAIGAVGVVESGWSINDSESSAGSENLAHFEADKIGAGSCKGFFDNRFATAVTPESSWSSASSCRRLPSAWKSSIEEHSPSLTSPNSATLSS